MALTKTFHNLNLDLAGGARRNNLFEVSIPSFPSSMGSVLGRVVKQERNGTFKFLCKRPTSYCSTSNSYPCSFQR